MFFRLILAQARTVRVIDYNKYNDVIVGYKTKKSVPCSMIPINI